MRSCNSYQDIKTPEDMEYEERVNSIFNELCDEFSDQIEEHGMNWMQKASLMERARDRENSKKAKKCKYCKGSGMVAMGTDMFGNTIKGLKECPICKGTGEKPNEETK